MRRALPLLVFSCLAFVAEHFQERRATKQKSLPSESLEPMQLTMTRRPWGNCWTMTLSSPTTMER